MIDVSSIPNNVVLLFSGGPASTLLAHLLWDRNLTLATVQSPARLRGQALRVKTWMEAQGYPSREMLTLKIDGVERKRGILVPRDLLWVRQQWQGLVAGTNKVVDVVDPARRAREQGLVDGNFVYLTTSTYQPRQGLARPDLIYGQDSMQTTSMSPGWVHEPLIDWNMQDIYREYQRLGLESLWAVTHSCCQEEPCVKCYDCRAREWAASSARTTSGI